MGNELPSNDENNFSTCWAFPIIRDGLECESRREKNLNKMDENEKPTAPLWNGRNIHKFGKYGNKSRLFLFF